MVFLVQIWPCIIACITIELIIVMSDVFFYKNNTKPIITANYRGYKHRLKISCNCIGE